MNDILGELERDAVTEILNVAIGRAGASLSSLIDDEVSLSIPRVEFLTPSLVAARLDQATGRRDSVAVRQHFKSAFAGDILLIFPEEHCLGLVRSMLRDTVPLESLTELEQEALLEIGNIILNACLGSLANQLDLTIESSLPAYIRGSGPRILEAGAASGELIMFLEVSFAMASKGITGFLAFVMDIASARQFAEAVAAYVKRALAG